VTQSIQRPPWASTGSPAESASGDGETLVLDFMEALATNDADTLVEYFDQDAMYQNMPLPPAYGREAVKATLVGLFTVLRIDKIDTFHIASRGDMVFTERVDLLTALPTSKSFELPVLGVLQLRDGKIVAWRDYFDLMSFEAAVDFSLRAP
jgi:limonene-1,2-epoxide hydrolase